MMIGDTETEVGDHSSVPGEPAPAPKTDKIQLFNRCVSARPFDSSVKSRM